MLMGVPRPPTMLDTNNNGTGDMPANEMMTPISSDAAGPA